MDILSRPVLQPDHRIAYGPGPQQFGDLWLPAQMIEATEKRAPEIGRDSNPGMNGSKSKSALAPGTRFPAASTQSSHLSATRAPFPTVVFFHGGWWQSEYDLGYAGYLCAALKQQGIAVWSVEYRRLGSTGGGWPATFLDAAAGLNFIPTLAKSHPIDLTRVITMGHSAGGHLAFWLAGLHHVDPRSQIYTQPTISLRGTIALAGVVDLRLTIDLSGHFTFAHDKQDVFDFMGGTPANQPERYRQANPGDLLPFNIPQILIQGADDTQIPPSLPTRWAAQARRIGDLATPIFLPHITHFDVVDPTSPAWPHILTATQSLLA